MKNRIIMMLMLVLCSTSFANNEVLELRSRFEKEFKKLGLPSKHVGIYLTIGEGDKQQEIISEINSQKKMIPASISKIATASAILENFPPGFKFKTQILSDGIQKNENLKGSVYLKGGGDPSFVSENMWFLVNAFLRTNIKKIEGDIIVDDSYFDAVRFDHSRQDERVDRAYDAPVGAMSFNWNSINIFVRPNKSGEAADIFLDPINNYVKLENQTKTKSGSGQNLSAERKEDKKFYGDIIRVSGTIGEQLREHIIYKNITQPDLWAGENLKSFFAQRGINITGSVRTGKTPEKARLLAESESKPIENILADMNKFSNNYVAEMLCKNLGALKQLPGTMASGIQIINEHLKKLNLPMDQFEIYNPSGLTRDNKMSAYAMWKLLIHLKNDFKVQPEFLASLPIAGIDGTLKKRMKDGPGERWVRAKTGLLTGVVALAGYAGRADGRVMTFVFIFNGAEDESKMRSAFDHLLVSLVQ